MGAAVSELDFRVLGPVEVIRDGQPVEFGGGTLAKLLAGLLLSANQVVSGDVLTEAVWDGRPPVHPRAALHTGIARMRRALGDGLIETLPYGYRLRTDPGHLDVLRFEQLIAAAGQAGSAEDAAAALAGAIGLWRGQPFENVDSPVLNEAVPRLTRRYLDACEQWAELGLQLGRHDAVAARLTALVDAHPFRERMVGQLILALLRGGRQADALAAYENLRRALGDEMGIDPSATLQELQLKILRADPSLTRDPLGDGDGRPGGGLHDGGMDGGPAGARIGEPAPPQAVPRQLPRDLPDFCGRDAEVAELTGFLDGTAPAAGETPVAAISGKAGSGRRPWPPGRATCCRAPTATGSCTWICKAPAPARPSPETSWPASCARWAWPARPSPSRCPTGSRCTGHCRRPGGCWSSWTTRPARARCSRSCPPAQRARSSRPAAACAESR
jgi:DNA-binding SARP family transcriptional activator